MTQKTIPAYCKEVMVSVVKYRTEDGKQFDNLRKAELHGMLLKGLLIKCHWCAGTGKYCKHCKEGYTDTKGKPFWLTYGQSCCPTCKPS